MFVAYVSLAVACCLPAQLLCNDCKCVVHVLCVCTCNVPCALHCLERGEGVRVGTGVIFPLTVTFGFAASPSTQLRLPTVHTYTVLNCIHVQYILYHTGIKYSW